MRKHPFLSAFCLLLSLVLSSCSSAHPFSGSVTNSNAIVVGSQDYFSNEIIAEIFAQSLENAGYSVDRDFRIGQREAYLPEIEAGNIDLFPEYSGNLLQYWDPTASVGDAQEVNNQLRRRTPAGISILNQAEATDEDVYVMTRHHAEELGVKSLADLARLPRTWHLGGPYELKERDYGPQGLASVYHAQVELSPIEDAGGPLTIKALSDGTVDIARMSSSSPAIADNDLLVLADPERLLPASHVVPLVSDKVDPRAREIINDLMARFHQEDIVALNRASVEQQKAAATIAQQWLAGQITSGAEEKNRTS
ncbi:glycine/betaine ABC transporter [Corynebacterium poyangense]|uniref:Glycine/betaine ABC transporter n=1 Tax=Corynebacterium poyangense TaxID=2684405 RepID=A0A7H0SMX6_9CORY|nr:ABC transporter substrate-binding protein [Corynebacterium poyangense]QNQ89901.1 glycine/betaine ABC transporter [Corynebacterium poyangense]